MRIIKLLLITLFPIISTAQECAEYYPITTGSYWETTQYDKKGKIESVSQMKVISYQENESGYNTSIKVANIDESGIENGTAEVSMKCINGIFYYDMRNFISTKTMSDSTPNMKINITGNDLQYPSEINSGDVLPNANITFQTTSNGIPIISITVSITDRIVMGKESITVPAGTFEVWKISYNLTSKTGFIKSNISAIEYISPGNGIVKSETYNKKGKLVGYSLLTKLLK